ncbi:LacI family DNA-binding transcriptional regulator [Deinococcus altitudinis]|uniref:LacI family DNA-binding transcriptional regulator n=1 Tax=Deinococcus altitudinis TaxID=468914 RepID=UPI0038914AA9
MTEAKLTIATLARSLGVSPATVSNAINNRGHLSEETRQRVLRAIDQSGYSPSFTAKALRTGRTQTIGLILPNITNPVFPLMAQEIEREVSARGQAVMLMDSQGHLDKQSHALESLRSRNVDAIILVACRGTGRGDVPDGVILIDAPSNPRSDVSSDHRLGGRLAAQHLIGLGHRRISVLAGPENSVVAQERFQGAAEVMAAAGLTFVRIHHSSYGLIRGEEYAVVHHRPDEASALYAVSDSLAVGVIRGLHRLGLRVPDDVSVMGFDDVVWAELITPSLSTIRQNVPAIAQAAVRLARREAQTDRAIPVELVVRQSTRSVSV